ncbi:MAG: PAS domain-containing protein [Sulfuricurvum sp.]|uniref:PAS domain-containing protein n=1 Tax=Sulfuricurvum sp. TaxID=2025608 RepID=UPI003D1376F0
MEIQMKPGAFIVSKTDLDGLITYGNETFIQMSGYSEKELLQTPHSILRHVDMPKVVFKLLWERIRERGGIYAYVKNKTKQGDHYWVFAYVTPSFDPSGETIGYYSVRRAPSAKAISVIEPLYRDLLEAEAKGGMNASETYLLTLLQQQGMTYDQFVLGLQK